mmetsp:Transcript_3026/g.5499  ORF Transcript_3026/g.5499 Transcript_3026/m.5499 type:complete len:549 (-) Transcript_3026:1117-2763(-)
MGACSSKEDEYQEDWPVEYDTHNQQGGAQQQQQQQQQHQGRPERKKKRSSLQQSLVRVGSKVLRPSNSKRGVWSATRASTYDHVHGVVLANFESSDVDARRAGIVGLRNLGNTCFLNSSLQCLSNTIPLTDYFLGYDYRKEINYDNVLGTNGELVTEYAKLMKQLWLGSNRSSSLAPSAFKRTLGKFNPQFQGENQHDAHELLSLLLDGVHEDLNRVKQRPYIPDKDCDGSNDEGDAILAWQHYLERNRSIIVDLFQGQLRNTMVCRNHSKKHPSSSSSSSGQTGGPVEHGCGHQNIKFEPFMYLSLPISDDNSFHPTTLDDCLDLYCTEEKMTGENQWYCPKCQEHVDATKKLDIWMLPPILIVHLKRFKYTESGQRAKMDTPVVYPIQQWDLSRSIQGKKGDHPRRGMMYDLYAVSNHLGGMGSGHYTAFGLNRFDDKWYQFNDSACTKLSVGNHPSSDLGHNASAYCLFYNRVDREQIKMPSNHTNNNTSSEHRTPVIRRQSIDRPELWPHLQLSKSFRDFSRKTMSPVDELPDEPAAPDESMTL